MKFLIKIEKRIKTKYFLYAFYMLILSALFVASAVATGFSSAKNTKIVLRGTEAGIAVSDSFLSIFLIIMGIAVLIGAFYFIKAGKDNKNYNLFVKNLKEIGDINVISEALLKTEKSKYAKKCELRYNNQVIFLLKGTDITIINPKSVSYIKAQMLRDKNGIHPYVSIYYCNKVIHIETWRNKNAELCNDIISKCNFVKGEV